MQKSTKVIVTILVIVVFFLLSAVLTGVRSSAGFSTPGFLGIILAFALLGALRAIWKKKNDNDEESLQK